MSRKRVTPSPHQMAGMALKIQRCLGVIHPDHHPSLQGGTQSPETWCCLEIQVISTEDDKMILPPPHAWKVPILEDMVWEDRDGLTEAIVTGPEWAILFYGWWSLEGLSLVEVRDITFTLSGVIAWVGKQVQLSTKPVNLGNGRQLITEAITEGHIEPKEPGHPCSVPPALTLFSFHDQDSSPCSASSDCWMMGGTLVWPSGRTAGMKLSATARLELRPKTTRVVGGSTPVTFAFIRSWIQE